MSLHSKQAAERAPDVPAVSAAIDALVDALEAHCSECSIRDAKFWFGNWGQDEIYDAIHRRLTDDVR